MTERLDEHKIKYAVDTDKEAEDICRWAAARAGVIVVAPVGGLYDYPSGQAARH